MRIGVACADLSVECRIAVTPSVVSHYCARGFEVFISSGAGVGSGISDSEFSSSGARIVSSCEESISGADIVLSVGRPSSDLIGLMKPGGVVIGLLSPWEDRSGLEDLAAHGVYLFSLELIPRISRAQSMDVLSSQANLSGYKAVIDGAGALNRAFPLMVTAAGTIPAARVFVIGAGVAGLQAIATARRLGAIVSATDVRRSAGEQVESLGAHFVMVEDGSDCDGEDLGGYAREMGSDYHTRQEALVSSHISDQDVVITTALVPGRPAPVLISREMVESMRSGSVIVDLAALQGGNCACTVQGERVVHDGVIILGYTDMPGRLAGNASFLYSTNMRHFVDLLHSCFSSSDGGVDLSDEILSATLLARDGALCHSLFDVASDKEEEIIS